MTEINQVSIFIPVLVIVALSVVGFFRMGAARAGAAKLRTDSIDYYRAYLGEPDPEFAVVAARHYNNLFETPVLFYTASLVAFVLGAVTPWLLIWAWCYAIARVAQSAIHLTVNKPPLRGVAFILGWLFLVAMWIAIAIGIFERL